MYTPEEVAAYFKVKVTTVYRWIREGKLKATKLNRKVYRISAEEVLRLERQ